MKLGSPDCTSVGQPKIVHSISPPVAYSDTLKRLAGVTGALVVSVSVCQ